MRIKIMITAMLVLTSIAAFGQSSCNSDKDEEPNVVTQHSWDAYDWVDTCNAKYAVVHDWIGGCGVYDLENHRNLTELEYRDLHFSQTMDLEDGSQSAMFYGRKGRMEGVVAVDHSGRFMSMMMPDRELIYTLDSCLTINKHLSKLCRKQLMKNVMAMDSVLYGQVLVMDTKKGDIKAWIALAKEEGMKKATDAELRKNQCSMVALKSILACISQDTTKLAYYPRDLDAMDIAATYSSIANGGNVIHPSVNSTQVCVDSAYLYKVPTAEQKTKLKNMMKDNMREGANSQWITKDIDIAGEFIEHNNCSPTLYDDNAYDFWKHKNGEIKNYDQLMFVGYLPSDNPQYTIFISLDKKGEGEYIKALSNIVNKLAKYLSKRISK